MRPRHRRAARPRRRRARDRARLRADARPARALRIEHTAIGHHRGGKLIAKGLGLAQRSGALTRWASGRRIDVALGHGSNDISVAAKLLRIESATAFDYEYARVQHTINGYLATRVVVPDVIPPERLKRYGMTPAKLRPYAGLKEEYYLADFEPDEAVLRRARPEPRAPAGGRAHPARGLALPPFEAPVFTEMLNQLKGEQVVVLPRTAEQRAEPRARGRVHRPRAGDRRPVADRVRRPRDLAPAGP